jgi:hypothetical protein
MPQFVFVVGVAERVGGHPLVLTQIIGIRPVEDVVCPPEMLFIQRPNLQIHHDIRIGLGVNQFAFSSQRYFQRPFPRFTAIGGERRLGLFSEAERLPLAKKLELIKQAWQEPTPRLLIFDNCEEKGGVSSRNSAGLFIF